MSDLEAVLERLLTDPVFQGALARNPEIALAGYTLSAEDRELLGVPLVSGPGEERTVEMRTTKSGVVGMLGPVASAFGVATGGGQVLGSAPGTSTLGSAPGSMDTFGHAPRSDGAGTLGSAAPPTETFGAVKPTETFGAVVNSDAIGAAPTVAANYSTRVDVDGDGSWDANTAYERAGGGVDIQADMNHDGVADFVGHDDNRDGLVDSADYDGDGDGVLDTRRYDDNGDGWMDRSGRLPSTPGEAQTLGNAPPPG